MKLIRSFFIAIGVWSLCANVAAAQGVGFKSTEYPVGAGPEAVVVADFDGNSKLDVAVANSTDNTVSILLGNGDGTFGAKTDFATGNGPAGIVAADFDGDGKLDLATVNRADSKVSILLGNGDGTFQPHTDFATGTNPSGMAVGDFNGDGKPDLVTANPGGDNISILPGLGGGVFGPSVNYAAGGGPVALVGGDFNGDGKLDVAVANVTDSTVSILLGNGNGTFGPKTDFATGSGPRSLAKGDFDGDKKLDLVTANYDATDMTASVLLGRGDGTFAPKTDIGTSYSPYLVAVADFNADDKADFLTLSDGRYWYWDREFQYWDWDYPTASLRLGNGDGTFLPLIYVPLSTYPEAMATGDFNADDRIDVVVANWYDDNVSVLLQSAAVSPSPYSVSFGTQLIGTSGAPQMVTLNSTGSFPATIASVALEGTDAGEFSVTADTCSGNTFPAGSNCTISVNFSPASVGNKSASLVITHDAPDSPITVSLGGTGIVPAPAVSLSLPSVNFGPRVLNTTSGAKTVALSNTGSATLTITSITLDGPNATEFILTNNCGASLGINASCNFSVTFQPSSLGAKSAELRVISNAATSPDRVQLTGTGVTPPAVSLSPESLTFNPQPLNTTSTAQDVILTNTGGAMLDITSITLAGPNADQFLMDYYCDEGLSLPPNWDCSISVAFRPSSIGAKSAEVRIETNAASSPDKLPLTGTGVVQFPLTVTRAGSGTGAVTSNPAGIDCGAACSAPFNDGTHVALTATAASGSAFTGWSGDCSGAGPCSVTMDAAKNVGAAFAKLPPSVGPLPPSVNFGQQLVNTTSAAQDVTIKNSGGETLDITTIALAGPNAAEFALTNNCGTSLNGGASCAVSLRFRPTATGASAASLSISSNASGSPHTVTLSGEGVDFSIGPAPGSSNTATVPKGGSTSFTVRFGSVNGFAGRVTLSCSTSSPQVSCTVPASVDVSSAAPTDVTVNVTTTMQAFAPFLENPRPPTMPASTRVTLAWLVSLLLLGALFYERTRRQGRTRLRLRTAAAFAGLVLCAQLWSGCGGNGATPDVQRTYQVTVTASPCGSACTVGLTVNVP